MRKLHEKEKDNLSEALIALSDNGITQKNIENATGIKQYSISKAKWKRIQTASPVFQALCEYANIPLQTHIQPGQRGIPQEVEAAYAAYLLRGGKSHNIVDMIQVLTSVAKSDDH